MKAAHSLALKNVPTPCPMKCKQMGGSGPFMKWMTFIQWPLVTTDESASGKIRIYMKELVKKILSILNIDAAIL